MNRNSRYLRGSSLNPTPRLRTVILALALAIGSAGQTPAAQAAPPGERVNFSMKVQHPKTKLRCGEAVEYLVIVEIQQVDGAPTPAPLPFGTPSEGLLVIGINVEAFSVNKTVGDFVGETIARTSLVFDDDLTGLAAKFKFKANKPGKTTLYFEGLVEDEYVSAKLDVTVLPCKFKVKTSSQMSWSGQYGSVEFRGLNVDGEVTGDETGIFTGTAPVIWLSTSAIPNCSAVNTMGESQVNMQGTLNESDQLVLELNYDTVAYSEVITCPGGGGSSSELLTVSPLQVTVPSSGGVVKLSQQIEGPMIALGSVNIYVIPEEDEAVAFNADSLAALSALEWWARLWDNFPWRFSALLALR